jgi:hypothetical protein
MAVPALLPPPFPLTPFILTCGALSVDRTRFFLTFSTMRLLRFGTEAILARRYGRGILRVLQSEQFEIIVFAFVILAVIGTTISAAMLWRSTRSGRPSAACNRSLCSVLAARFVFTFMAACSNIRAFHGRSACPLLSRARLPVLDPCAGRRS